MRIAVMIGALVLVLGATVVWEIVGLIGDYFEVEGNSDARSD